MFGCEAGEGGWCALGRVGDGMGVAGSVWGLGRGFVVGVGHCVEDCSVVLGAWFGLRTYSSIVNCRCVIADRQLGLTSSC